MVELQKGANCEYAPLIGEKGISFGKDWEYGSHVTVSEYKSRERDLEDVIDGFAIDGHLFKYK